MVNWLSINNHLSSFIIRLILSQRLIDPAIRYQNHQAIVDPAGLSAYRLIGSASSRRHRIRWNVVSSVVNEYWKGIHA